MSLGNLVSSLARVLRLGLCGFYESKKIAKLIRQLYIHDVDAPTNLEVLKEGTMFGALHKMFAPSPRPNKRQRTNQEDIAKSDAETARKPRASQRNASRELSIEPFILRVNANPRGDSILPKSDLDSDTTSRVEFNDSAYQSMGPSPDDDNDDEEIPEQIKTPSRRSRRLGEVLGHISIDDDARKVKGSTSGRSISTDPEDKGSSILIIENGVGDTYNEEATTAVRSSRRARTKTWKSSELDVKTQSTNTPTKSIQYNRRNTRRPVTPNEQKVLSNRTPMLAKSNGGISKKGTLEMPRKYVQQSLSSGHGDIREHDHTLITPRQSKSTSLIEERKTRSGKSMAKIDPLGGVCEHIQNDPIHIRKRLKRQDDLSRINLERLLMDNEYREVVLAMKDHILRHLTATGPLPLCGEGHSLAYKKVYQILEQTVTAGEGNSMLLIGARSTAKSTIVETALKELNLEFKDQFHTIRLNGFLHTDDKLALKEIWRQLGKEMSVEDNSMNDRGNYADTLTSLLALLSQPEELPASDTNRTTSRSVIFILEEFDLFTTHPRQILLYNLFDIAQSRKAPIAVVGLTTRIDIVESLEKRVKSRFSHRYVHVSHPKSLFAYRSIIRSFLLASAGDEDQSSTKTPALDDLQNHYSSTFPQLHEVWSKYINHILSNPSILRISDRHYHQTKCPQAFLNAFLVPIMQLPALAQPADLLQNHFTPADSNLHLLPSLSDASLTLLIAAARLDIVCDTDTVTFNMAYDEYVRLAQRSRLVASASGMLAISGSTLGGTKGVLGRDVALAAWERLEEIGLLLPITGQGGQTQGATIDLGRGGRLVRVDVGLEEIGAAPELDLGPMLKWCKEI